MTDSSKVGKTPGRPYRLLVTLLCQALARGYRIWHCDDSPSSSEEGVGGGGDAASIARASDLDGRRKHHPPTPSSEEEGEVPPAKTRHHVRLPWALAALLFSGQVWAAPTNIAVELVAESPAQPGGTVTLAIHMRPAKGWHGYWRNPGDAGLGMKLDWSLPNGASAGAPQYPVPETLLISGLMNHVYHGPYAVLVPLSLPQDAKPGERLPVALDARWLACTDAICVPEQGRFTTVVEVGRPAASARFDRWRARLPAPLAASARFSLDGQAIRLGIPLPEAMALDAPHVFVAGEGIADYGAPQAFARAGDLLVVTLQRPDFEPRQPARIDAVLRLNGMGDGLAFAGVPGSVPRGGAPLATGAALSPSGLPLLLLGALIGGLLLNIMPCVFPILSLKALSLARAGQSEAHARVEGIAYGAGVIAACMALGALLLAFRAAGAQVGWAFQLQEPGVVAALLLLATAITANFLGLFEFAVPGFAEDGSPRGAFATGLLAAFVATPCTGPFMAAAMGAALLLPVAEAMALFAALGLGIALPFLAVALVPALRARLPRPGPWMARFRRWMALPMGLTALALVWLASRVGGTSFAIGMALFSVFLVAGLVHVGRSQRAGRPAIYPALAAILVPLLATVQLARLSEPPPTSAARSIIATMQFSEAALAAARATGKPVFLYFTADWCLTCKLNEQVAIEREATRDAFDKAGVIVIRGDWTRRDPEITRFLTSQGAAGVPLYLWYPAGGGEPEQLEQVLTQDRLLELARGAR